VRHALAVLHPPRQDHLMCGRHASKSIFGNSFHLKAGGCRFHRAVTSEQPGSNMMNWTSSTTEPWVSVDPATQCFSWSSKPPAFVSRRCNTLLGGDYPPRSSFRTPQWSHSTHPWFAVIPPQCCSFSLTRSRLPREGGGFANHRTGGQKREPIRRQPRPAECVRRQFNGDYSW